MLTFNFNKIIKTLIITDFFIYSGWGLIAPVFAVFILDSIRGGDAQVAGTAAGIYWVVKSLIQIPMGKFLDRNHGEKDDYWFMVTGTFFASLTPLMLIFAAEPWHIYGLQVFYAICMAMVIPSWGGMFMRHADKGREAETWGFESSLLGVGMGMAGILGGFIANALGFTPIFIVVSAFGIFASFLLLVIRKDISQKGGKVAPIRKVEHAM